MHPAAGRTDQSPDARAIGDAVERNPYECRVSYQDHWKAYLHKQEQEGHAANNDPTVVYDCCSVRLGPSAVTAKYVGLWVWACTSLGLVYAWKVPSSLMSNFNTMKVDNEGAVDDDEWNEENEPELDSAAAPDRGESTPKSSLLSATCQFRINHDQSALYRLKIVTVSKKNDSKQQVLLFVAGENCGILVFDVDILLGREHGLDNNFAFPLPRPLWRYEPYPRPYGSTRILDFHVNVQANVVTAVANDDWGLYRWRMSTGERIPIRIAQRKLEDGPISCFHSLSDPGQHGACSLLVGTTSGIVYRLEEGGVMKDNNAMDTDESDGAPSLLPSPTDSVKLNVRDLLQLPEATLTHIVRVHDCWWTVVGTTTSSGPGRIPIGYVTTIHAPTQSVVHTIQFRGTPQRVLYSPYRHHLTILTNSSIVELVQAVSLDPLEKKWTTLKSCHGVATLEATPGDAAAAIAAAAMTPGSDWTVICGVGKQLDVYRGTTRVAALAASIEKVA